MSDDASEVYLLDSNGQRSRRLVKNTGYKTPAHFVATYNNPMLSYAGCSTKISIKRIVTASEQESYQPTLTSRLMDTALQRLHAGDSTEDVWEAISANRFPLQEPDGDNLLLTFVYRGAKNNVLIFGAPSNDHGWMKRLGNTDIWFKSYSVPSDTRLAYQLAPDVPEFNGTAREQRVALMAKAQRDPLNPLSWPVNAPDLFHTNSVVSLSDAPEQVGVIHQGNSTTPSFEFAFDSEILGNSRKVSVYSFGDTKRANAIQLVLFDGPRFIELSQMPAILQGLVDEQKLPPVEAVFIDNLDSKTRGEELPDNADFTRMLTDELLPHIAKLTHTTLTSERRVVAGSSYGGIGASTTAFRASSVFGNVVSMSGSYWWSPHRGDVSETHYYVSDLFAAEKQLPIRFFISAGKFEYTRNGSKDILDGSRHLRDILTLKGYDVHYTEYSGGHDYLVWQGALVDGLLALFSKNSTVP